MAGKFEIDRDRGGQIPVPAEGQRDEIIATSKAYVSKAAAKNGIASVQKNAPGGVVVDLSDH